MLMFAGLGGVLDYGVTAKLGDLLFKFLQKEYRHQLDYMLTYFSQR